METLTIILSCIIFAIIIIFCVGIIIVSYLAKPKTPQVYPEEFRQNDTDGRFVWSCKKCSHAISKADVLCPNCGGSQFQRLTQKQFKYARIQRKAAIIGFPIVILLLILGFVILFFMGSSEQAQQNAAAPADAAVTDVEEPPAEAADSQDVEMTYNYYFNTALQAASSVSVETVINDYEANAEAADNVYKDKWLVVSGEIEYIDKSIWGESYITMRPGWNGDAFIYLNDDFSENMEKAKNLKEGQTVKMLAYCSGQAMGSVQFTEALVADSSTFAPAIERDSVSESIENTSEITYDEYLQIHEGMTYAEVCKIIGGAGKTVSSYDVGNTTIELYSWDGNSLGASASVSFENGAVTDKSQFGLK